MTEIESFKKTIEELARNFKAGSFDLNRLSEWVKLTSDDLLKTINQREKAIKERDEARAELQRLRDDHARTLGEYDAIKVAHEQLKKTSLHDVLIEAKRQRDVNRTELDAERLKALKLEAELRNTKLERDYWEKRANRQKEKTSAPPTRPEPSRLEIAAMILAGGCANPELATNEDVALAQADALIAASKEEVVK